MPSAPAMLCNWLIALVSRFWVSSKMTEAIEAATVPVPALVPSTVSSAEKPRTEPGPAAPLATTLEMPSTYKLEIGTDAVAEAEKVCRRVMAEFPIVTFVGGKIIFARETWFNRFLHNETALAIQKRLYWMGATMVVLPAKVT